MRVNHIGPLVTICKVLMGSRVQPQEMSRGMKLRVWKIEVLHYLYSENKASADQPRSSAKNEYSHDAARITRCNVG